MSIHIEMLSWELATLLSEIKLCVGIVLSVLAGRLLAFVVLDQCFGQLTFVIFYHNVMQHEPYTTMIVIMKEIQSVNVHCSSMTRERAEE